jgi:DtxR family Mn-dependent transcriptional regulator
VDQGTAREVEEGITVIWNSRAHRHRHRKGGAPFKPGPIRYGKEGLDELLELIYVLRESGGQITTEELKRRCDEEDNVDTLLKDLVSRGLVIDDEGVVSFSEVGEREAETLIRAHRLAERLLTDVLLVKKEQQIESQACAMEHILNPEVVDNICTILGHPRTCPHGLEIPPGPCCKDRQRRASPAVSSLDQLRSGEKGRILYVETANHARLDQLTSFGMLPGTIVKVHQRQPSLVVLIGETQLAIDREIAENIHVVKTG